MIAAGLQPTPLLSLLLTSDPQEQGPQAIAFILGPLGFGSDLDFLVLLFKKSVTFNFKSSFCDIGQLTQKTV